MARRALWLLILTGIVLAVAAAAISTGYYIHRTQVEPVYGLTERVIRKIRRMGGHVTETQSMVERIETTYLTLRGRAYLMPGYEFRNGGALALWGDEVIVLHGKGKIFVLDESAGLQRLDLPVPDNNLEAYVKLAAAEYPDQFAKEDALRYNDLEFVDTPVFRGLLLSYTYIDLDRRCYQTRVDRLPVPDTIASIRDLEVGPDDWQRFYESEPCLAFNETRELIVGYMAGGRMVLKEPGLLYLGNGEYHRAGFYRPDAGVQSDDSDYGKVIEIDLATGASRHFSKGHRNLQGITLDLEGRVWTTEHGMRGGDELNLIRDQVNYGWPLENLGTLYSGLPAPTEGAVGRHEIYQAPVYAWLPSAAVSSMATVDGFDETWDGDLLIGSLRARTLFRARIRGERVVFLESIPIGQRIRDVMQVGPHKLALWLDTEEVVILTIEPRADPLDGLVDGLVAQGMDPALAGTVNEVLVACNECHSFDEHVHWTGPSLFKLSGRDVASTAFADYSAALQGVPGVWDSKTLAAYLTEPEAVAPGTAMSGLGVGNPEVAAAVVQAFEWLNTRSISATEK